MWLFGLWLEINGIFSPYTLYRDSPLVAMGYCVKYGHSKSNCMSVNMNIFISPKLVVQYIHDKARTKLT